MKMAGPVQDVPGAAGLQVVGALQDWTGREGERARQTGIVGALQDWKGSAPYSIFCAPYSIRSEPRRKICAQNFAA